jgi:hypothetical protein
LTTFYFSRVFSEGSSSEAPLGWEGGSQRTILPGNEPITINVPLFKKLRDIIFFLRDNHFMSHFKGHFEGAKTFLGVKKVEAPSKCPEKWLIK